MTRSRMVFRCGTPLQSEFNGAILILLGQDIKFKRENFYAPWLILWAVSKIKHKEDEPLQADQKTAV